MKQPLVTIQKTAKPIKAKLLFEQALMAAGMLMFPISLVMGLVLITSMAVHAEDFGTINHHDYSNVTVTREEPDGIVVRTKNGISKLYFAELPPAAQQKYHYHPAQAAQFAASQVQAAEEHNAQVVAQEQINATIAQARAQGMAEAAVQALAKAQAETAALATAQAALQRQGKATESGPSPRWVNNPAATLTRIPVAPQVQHCAKVSAPKHNAAPHSAAPHAATAEGKHK